MPSPTTASELLDLVRKSGVVEEKRLTAYLDKLAASGVFPLEPAKLAGLMVRDGILTHFQAEQFLLGKWRRFTIGKYKVLERLGAGGMGSVYLCEHKFMRRRVAVKVLPTAKAEDPAALERFYREARAVGALDHINIVRAHDIDQDDKLHFIVMEHIDGSSLQEIVKKTGPLDIARAANYIRQAAMGLQHAHEKAAIVHRDIKPGNILVDRNGIVKILDMGLARFFQDDDDAITRKYDESVLGTADYLAPEQAINSHEVDIRADIYSLGATFYFCLTGKTPFAEGSVAQKLIWHQTRHPKSVKSLRPDVPEGIVAVVEKAMSKDPGQRFSLPQDMSDALAPWTQTPVPAPSPAEMPQLSRAAMGSGSGDTSISGSAPTTNSNASLPPSSRKTWLCRTASPLPVSLPPADVPLGSEPPVTAPVSKAAGVSPKPVREIRAGTASPITGPAASSPTAPGNSPRPVVRTATTRRGQEQGASGQLAKPSVSTTTDEEDSPSWETVAASDTEELNARADTAPNPRRKNAASSRRHRSPLVATIGSRGRDWQIAGSVLFVLVFLLIVVLRLIIPSPKKPVQPTIFPQRGYHLVTAADPGGTARSLVNHLNRANNGDLIEIADDIIYANLTTEANSIVRGKNLTIQSFQDRNIVWRCPENSSSDLKLFILANAPGFTIRNITFDGADKLDTLITLFGDNPGLTLENVQLQNFRKNAISVMNCTGSMERPVLLSGLRFVTSRNDQSALCFDALKLQTKKLASQYITLRDCVFEGPGTKIKTPDLAFVGAGVELPSGVEPFVSP